MLAQVCLTPAESKSLIAKAVAKMKAVKEALAHNMVVLHPSTSTYFLVEEITGQKPTTNIWKIGVIVPKGACRAVCESENNSKGFVNPWVIKEGNLTSSTKLEKLLGEMGTKDVYIKGVNALDPQGNAGLLWGNVKKGGSFGLVLGARKKKGFNVILPVGLEKLIPIPVKEAAKEAKRYNYDFAMGLPCGILPCEGIVVTELRAIEMLSGAKAVPIAAGGVGGAEGAVTLVIKGDKKQVRNALEYVESVKGAKLPKVHTYECEDCPQPCEFPLKVKKGV